MTFRNIYTAVVNYRKIIAIGATIIALSGSIYKVAIAPRLEVKALQETVVEQNEIIILKDATILIKDFNNTREHADRSVYEVNLTIPESCEETDVLGLNNGGYTIGL